MSRSGYVDDFDEPDVYLYRGQVASSIRGKRGQEFLRELRDALDAMPVKELIAGELVGDDGACCAIGCIALARGLDVSDLDPEDAEAVGKAFDIAEPLAREIVYENDEYEIYGEFPKFERLEESPAERWQRMRKWVDGHIKSDAAEQPSVRE